MSKTLRIRAHNRGEKIQRIFDRQFALYKSMKRFVFTILIVLALNGLAHANLVDSNSIIKDDIEYYFQTDNSIYNLGETVEMLYKVTNLGDVPVTFDFGVVQQSRFEVSDGTQTVWRWPKLVNPQLSSFTLNTGEYKEFLKNWDMINDNTGTLVIPGDYNVFGVLNYPTTHDKYVPVSVDIQVIPEPATLILLGTGLMGILSFRRRKR